MVTIAEKVDADCLKDLQPNSLWEAKLCLGFTANNDKTVLSKRRHVGPLTVQRPFYPENNGTCHLYILHPPGGVVGGDSLHIDVDCTSNTSVLITTPAANKFYRSAGLTAWQTQLLTVKNSATLEWLPQETILFDGCRVRSKTIVNLDENAKFFGWEIVSFGRPASKELFTQGMFKQSFEIWKCHEPLLIDRTNIHNRAEVFNSYWGLGNKPVMGIFTIVSRSTLDLLEAQSEIQDTIKHVCNLSVTLIGEMLICRCLDSNAITIRECFVEIWGRIRSKLLDKQPCAPRIWAT